jgi:acetoacetyl-CoA synthetase
MTTPLWTPSDDRINAAALTKFQSWIGCGSYDELWRWSVADIPRFWASIAEYFDVRFETPSSSVLAGETMPGANWFPGARLSYADHIFRDRDPTSAAIFHASELRSLDTWTWGQLLASAAAVASGLRRHGVGPGDRVAAYMPNIPETVAAFLGCASIGAVWSSAAPEFGARSVIDRFAQIEPKVLLAVDGYRYGGRDFDRRETARTIASELGEVRLVTFGYLDATGWEDGFLGPAAPAALECASLPFDHPLWVLYSSGTTGLPKPIVHGQGGILFEHLKQMHLHLDAKPGDRVFWFSTTGWMMWNFLVGVLLTDAAIVLYDGSPGYPDLAVLWDLAEDTGATCFGTSAGYIESCMKAGIKPRSGRRTLARLRSLGSTGSPLAPEAFDWVYEALGSETWLFSTSGGTDLCTAFVGGVPTLPVYRGELQARALGASVEAWDRDGRALVDEVGELVITKPMPSMPLCFWGDTTGDRYRDSYFAMYPGTWRHADWIKLTARGTAVIFGRSDSTINRGGVRMGTSELYRAALSMDDVLDALVVDVPRAGTTGWMPLFVVLRQGILLRDELAREIQLRIREYCSPRHVPDAVLQIAEVPRTLSGKVLEVPVKRILAGAEASSVVSPESLANPAALAYFEELAQELGRESKAA